MILDEAQDTNDIQMKIIDCLCDCGLNQIMLVGDPDQAIFEWNNAKPKLFKNKFNDWRDNSILLNDNRRSSQLICNATFNLSTLDNISVAVDENVKKLDIKPEIIIFDAENIQHSIDYFLEKCRNVNIEINQKNVAIICRSKNFVSHILGNPILDNFLWTEDSSFTYPIAHACFLFNKGLLKEAFKICETAIFKIINNTTIVTKNDIENYINKIGFIKHRSFIYSFLKQFPMQLAN